MLRPKRIKRSITLHSNTKIMLDMVAEREERTSQYIIDRALELYLTEILGRQSQYQIDTWRDRL
jgi:predicted transcriptional regulator